MEKDYTDLLDNLDEISKMDDCLPSFAYLSAKEAAQAIRALQASLDKVKQDTMGLVAVAVTRWADNNGLPNGHLHANHYDVLASLGAKMDSYKRHS